LPSRQALFPDLMLLPAADKLLLQTCDLRILELDVTRDDVGGLADKLQLKQEENKAIASVYDSHDQFQSSCQIKSNQIIQVAS